MNAEQYSEECLHWQINGPTEIIAGDLAVINPTEALPVGVGPGNVQPFQSGKSSNVRTTWIEQGWGHDSQRWASYPFSQGDNPARRHSRIKSMPAAERENFALHSYDPILGPQNERQAFWQRSRRTSNAHGAVVNIPDSVPWSSNVPTYGGGAVPHPGIDIPLGDLYGA